MKTNSFTSSPSIQNNQSNEDLVDKLSMDVFLKGKNESVELNHLQLNDSESISDKELNERFVSSDYYKKYYIYDDHYGTIDKVPHNEWISIDKSTKWWKQPLPPNTDENMLYHQTVPGYDTREFDVVQGSNTGSTFSKNCVSKMNISCQPYKWRPQYSHRTDFVPQMMAYDVNKLEPYAMDIPYKNAKFTPQNPLSTSMYDQMVAWCAYPYGVPVILDS